MRPILYSHVLLKSCKLTLFLKRMRMLSATKPRSHPRLSKAILRILPTYGNIFEGNNFPKQYHALDTVFNLLYSYNIIYIFYKIHCDSKVFMHLAKT